LANGSYWNDTLYYWRYDDNVSEGKRIRAVIAEYCNGINLVYLFIDIPL
jgi:hypothetical protein